MEIVPGDGIRINHKRVEDQEFEVADRRVQDLGLTSVLVLALVSGSEQWSLRGTTATDEFVLSPIDGDEEFDVSVKDITIVERKRKT